MNAIKLSTLLAIFLAMNVNFGCNGRFDQKVMTLPTFNLLLTDSKTIYTVGNRTSGEQTLLIYFDPDCKYSRQQIESIIKNIKSFQGVHLYLFSMKPVNMLAEFSEHYKLGNYNNITIGRDYENYFAKNFAAQTVPWVVIYGNDRKVKKIIQGRIDIGPLTEILQG